MKKAFILLISSILSLNLLASQEAFEQGMYYLRLARKAQSLFDEKENLARAYLQFKQSPTNESRLLKIYIGSRLSKENEIDQIATDIIKENRGNFRDCVAGLSMAEENEKDAIIHYLNMIPINKGRLN